MVLRKKIGVINMNSKLKGFFIILLVGMTMLYGTTYASGGENKAKAVKKVTGAPTRTYLDINNISTQFYYDGNSDIDPSGNSGFVYPKGSGKTAVFESGFLWGALVPGDPQPRVGGSAYRQGLQGGPIVGGVPVDANGAAVRIYRVRPDIYPNGPVVDLSSAAANEGTDPATLRAQYEKDWNEWPYNWGAPYYTDSLGNKYPGVKGADQTIWYVANDMNSAVTTYLYGAQPLGIEQQTTIWAYAQTGALGNMLFRKYKIINKSNTEFDSMYVSQWSDVDDGDATDDYSGCDTLLSLGYTYNAKASDAVYSPLPPPAIGFDFFQGPLVKGVAGQDLNKNGVDDASDYGIKNGKVVGPGWINLPMTSFYYFARGDAAVTDPTQGSIEGSTQFYRFFKGQIGKTGEPFRDPQGRATSYALSGDPVNNTGWLDGQLLPAGDRRMGMASGPFTMAVGDTQEVVVAEIVAGATTNPYVDRIAAVGLLKFYDKRAQNAYDNFFELPSPPPGPSVKVVELDHEIVLDWGEDNAAVARTENDNNLGYKFEGYNVYQLPSASSPLSAGKRIATFDLVDGVLKILDDDFDAASGVVLQKVMQFGSDNGVKHYIDIKTDELSGGTPLVNGIKYYFAVTAYNFKDKASPNNLESTPIVLTAIPKGNAPGTRYSNVHGDTLKVTHVGTSDGSVIPIVIDPSKLTGHVYKVTFTPAGDDFTWNLIDSTLNKTLLSGQTNMSGDDNYSFVDGMQIKVLGPPKGVKDWTIPSGTRRFTFSGADGLGFEGFSGAIGYASPRTVFGDGTYIVPAGQLKNVVLKLAKVTDTTTFHPTMDPTDANMSYGYRYGRAFTGAPKDPRFAPYMINKSGSGYLYQDFTKSVPLSAWDVNDPAHPRRLEVGYLENNSANGLLDGEYWPGDYNVYNNTASSGPREWLFIFNSTYSESPNPAYQVEVTGGPQPIMYFLAVNRRGPVQFSPNGSGTDQFEILANFINTDADKFVFTAPAASYSAATAKEDVKNINVFPNPYYGANSQEINKYNRFVTFSHLPQNAKIRIFNLAGVLVRTIDHTSDQYERWDLANQTGLPVASGLYIAYIDMPDLGVTKILKLAIIQEQQILDRF
jgi:hypothetical protein